MRNCAVIIATIAFISISQMNGRAEPDAPAQALAILQEKGLKGFVDAIKAGTNPIPPQAIVSDKLCANVPVAEEKQLAQQRRDLGLALLKKMSSSKTNATNVQLSDVDDVLTVRSWELKKSSYGNLVLDYVAEDSAVTLLLRLLADPKNDVAAIRLRVDACLRDSPSSAFWLSALDEEKDSVRVETKKGDESADYLKLASVIEAIAKKKTAELGGGEFSFGFGGDYDNCYSKYNPAQVGWLLARLVCRKIALESCLVVREKLGQMPTEQKDFMLAVKQYASPIIKKEDRLGGQIDATIVWNVWRDALGK